MIRTLLLAAAMAPLSAAAMAMPVQPIPAVPDAVQTVQFVPPDYPYDPCQPGAPPIRITQRDEWGRPYPVLVPAYRFCRGGQAYAPPPPVYAPPPPQVYAPPPPRGFDEYGRPIYRRPPPPGWERDPYTGRDTRILR